MFIVTEYAALNMSYRCIVTTNVLWLYLTVQWVDLQCVIVAFPDDTHLFFILVKILIQIELYLLNLPSITFHLQIKFTEWPLTSIVNRSNAKVWGTIA